jgi:ATP-dependent Clp protease ATP-binding subunit ClpA
MAKVIDFNQYRSEEQDISTMDKDALLSYLDQLRARAAVNGIQLSVPEELARELSLRAKQQGGARQMRHLVQEKVEGPLAVFLLKCNKKPGKIKMRLENGKLTFQG